MVVSAVADAHDEWKDTVNLPNFRDNWVICCRYFSLQIVEKVLY